MRGLTTGYGCFSAESSFSINMDSVYHIEPPVTQRPQVQTVPPGVFATMDANFLTALKLYFRQAVSFSFGVADATATVLLLPLFVDC